MRGASLAVHVTTPSPELVYSGPTVPKFVHDLTVHTPDAAKLTKYVDVSAVLATTAQGTKEVRLAIVNRSEERGFEVPVRFGPEAKVKGEVVVHEVWHEDLRASNWFGEEKVGVVTRKETFAGTVKVKKHSFQSMSLFSLCACQRLNANVLSVLVFELSD
jgi:alpha-N-arabinofuranosidase